jgi:hypothetical protein
MENNERLDDLLRELGVEGTEGKTLQELARQEEGFGPDFADRVTAVAFDGNTQDLSFYLPRMFRWVVFAGAAAALILLILTWYNNQVLDADAVAGISELAVTDAFAENLF